MDITEICARIEAHLPASQVEARLDGDHLHLAVTWAGFEGLTPVKRQQAVYAAVAPAIASGAVHAVHMTTTTPQHAGK